MCHYCGYTTAVPETCPECGNGKINYVGYGTQKAEDAVTEQFDGAKVIRLDADTANTKLNLYDILEKFRNKEADILIGTQMVTKGHDFPDVTLVGILLADSSLYTDDYRANERTFSLITQVIGRAGRAEKNGIALIQTYNPEHPVILKAAAQDYKSFFEDEISLRKTLVFPPFCDIALFGLSSDDETVLNNACIKFSEALQEFLADKYNDVKIYIYGPFEAPIYKVNEQYRKRFIAKCKMNFKTRNLFTEIISEFSKKIGKKVSISIDINPNNL
jgi:primosomal protein N' (replication factor Y)